MGNYLITGAAGGMGSALCRMLTARGNRVWGLDRAPAASPEDWTLIPADVTDGGSLQAALERIGKEAGSLDGIVHTAGVYDLNSLAEMPEEDFLRIVDPNPLNPHPAWQLRTDRLFDRVIDNGKVLAATGMAQKDLMPLYDGLRYEIGRCPADFHFDMKSSVNLRMDDYLKKSGKMR